MDTKERKGKEDYYRRRDALLQPNMQRSCKGLCTNFSLRNWEMGRPTCKACGWRDDRGVPRLQRPTIRQISPSKVVCDMFQGTLSWLDKEFYCDK